MDQSSVNHTVLRGRGRWRHLVMAVVLLVAGVGLQAAPAEAVPPPLPIEFVNCHSHNFVHTSCSRSASIVGAVMVAQLSHTPCVKGVTWDLSGGDIHVWGGCRALFRISYTHELVTVSCSSWAHRYNQCQTWPRRTVVYSDPFDIRSSATCREGYSWGQTTHGVWVDRGCRASFILYVT